MAVENEARMHLLLINPNTTQEITDLLLREARKIVSPGTRVSGATGRFGARYIASRAACAVAGHAALDAYAEHGRDADGIVLACFGDPGLWGLKELAWQPVIGMAEAACRLAAEQDGRFSIVTGGERWGPMLEEFVAALGLSGRLASVETVAPSGAEIARDPERALAMLAVACRGAVTKAGAARVILAGAGLAGLASRIQADVPVPLIDGLAASLQSAEQLVASLPRKPSSGDFAPTPPVETQGLGKALALCFTERLV